MRPSVPDTHHFGEPPLAVPLSGQRVLPGFDRVPTACSPAVDAVSPSATASEVAQVTARVPKGAGPLLDYLP